MNLTSPTRLTPSTAVPPSQNTAPVVKFRCLFTFDLRRKAKRWQDGFLRFHTFNSRLMVYSTGGDFIGDLHMLKTSNIQEGDQLELDRALVDVGECLETTETDLSELLDKRKSNSTESSENATPRRIASRAATFSSNTSKAKSLSELLGKNRAPIGRAAVPTKSPFEIREQSYQTKSSFHTDRPAKKQKHAGNSGADVVSLEGIGNSVLRNMSNNGNMATACIPKTNELNDLSMAFQPASALKITSRSGARKSSKPSISNGQKSITTMLPSDKRATVFPSSGENTRNKLVCLEFGKSLRDGARTGRDSVVSDCENTLALKTEANFIDSCSVLPTGGISRHRSKKIVAGSAPSQDSSLAFIPSTSTMRVLEESFNETGAPPSSQRASKSISEFFKPSQAPPLFFKAESGNAEQPPEPRSGSDRQPLLQKSANHSITSLLLPRNSSNQQKKGPAKGLVKSLSDTSTIRPRPNPSSRTLQTRLMIINDNFETNSSLEDEKRGPWTSEALDFFDWWPPDRPKPQA